MRSDIELANLLVEFALDAAERIRVDETVRSDFETFTRTKKRSDRDKWLAQSQRIAEVMAKATGKAIKTDGSAHPIEPADITSTLLSDLGALSVRVPRPGTSPTRSPRLAALAAGAAVSTAFAPAVAVPLGVIAGGVYMAGRGRRELQRLDETTDDKTARARRARRSKVVQNVVALAAFVVTSASAAD